MHRLSGPMQSIEPPHWRATHPINAIIMHSSAMRTNSMHSLSLRAGSILRCNHRVPTTSCHTKTHIHTTATPPGDRLPPERIHVPVARTRRSHCLPHASTAPQPRACTSPAHTDRVNHLRPRTHSARTLALRPRPELRPPSLARIGSALSPSAHRRAHRDRLDAQSRIPPRRHRWHAGQHCTPPSHRTGRKARKRRECTHQSIDRARSGATSTQRRHAAAPTRPRHACMCVYIGAPPLRNRPNASSAFCNGTGSSA